MPFSSKRPVSCAWAPLDRVGRSPREVKAAGTREGLGALTSQRIHRNDIVVREEQANKATTIKCYVLGRGGGGGSGIFTLSSSPQSSHGHRLLVAQDGAMVTPRPTPSEHAAMKRLRRELPAEARILMPETATFAKRNVVMPPRTQSGMDVKNAAI